MNSISNAGNETIFENKSQFLSGVKKYIVYPIKSGLYGFTLVFTIILIVKLFSFLIGTDEIFNLDLMDVMLSSMGFFFMSLIHILKNFN